MRLEPLLECTMNAFFGVQIGIETVPFIIGHVSYLLLSKPAKGVHKKFNLLSLLDAILLVYK